MTSGLDEVQASIDTVIHDFLPVDPVLLLQVRVETRFNVLDDRLPAGKHVFNTRTRNTIQRDVAHTTHRC